jgi:hypothetical protein
MDELGKGIFQRITFEQLRADLGHKVACFTHRASLAPHA